MSRVSKKADAVIIGGGATGLGLAYRLVKKGMKNVVVFERGYIGSGASGRFPGGVTQQLSTKEEITLARNGVKMLERLSPELNHNIMFRRSGSLNLAFNEGQVKVLEDSVRLQNLMKVKSRFIGQSEVKKMVPMLDVDKIIGAAFCPTDGIAYPMALLWGYTQAIKREGGKIRAFSEVKGIKVEGGEVKSVATDNGEIETCIVVNAAGACSGDVAKMTGLDIPNQVRKQEFLVTEPLSPFLDPFILSPRDDLWLAQLIRGETVCSLPSTDDVSLNDTSSSIEFLERIARFLIEIMPQFRDLKVMRQWAGLYDATPDGKPVLGELDGVKGFIQANGFCGCGLGLPTSAGELLAVLLVDGKSSPLFKSFRAERFFAEKSKDTSTT